MTMSRGRRDVSMSSSLNVVAGVDATRVVVARVAREEFAKLVTANASAPFAVATSTAWTVCLFSPEPEIAMIRSPGLSREALMSWPSGSRTKVTRRPYRRRRLSRFAATPLDEGV